MTTEEMNRYWMPARRNLFPDDTFLYPDVLDEALGVDLWSAWFARCHTDGEHPLSEDMKQLLIKLAGPHGQTILKAYRLQQGLK